MLNSLHDRSDLLNLTPEQEIQLCAEIREFLIRHVAQTGGHLASNLGVVELTVALHKVYDTRKDRLLFDVGHQAYVHKILTGRQDRFTGLRTYGGLSGFPKPSESEHDAFVAGHASDAVSVALGMARARSRLHEDYDVVVVLGDGALTGGLAYEGLNDAGESKEPMVVVLNDNGMSISRNVGAVAKHLSLVRLKPGYFGLKKAYRQFTKKIPGGQKLYALSHRVKTWMRRKLIGVTLFEEMGFQYLGPVDGHDTQKMEFLLRQAKEMHEPVLLHVITKKGKGYSPAEVSPSNYHGVGSFDPNLGMRLAPKRNTFSDTFGQELCDMAKEDPRVCAVTAAMEYGTGLHPFALRYPDRYFDVGIAEGHAVSMAAGMAKQGLIPVFAVYSTFLQRAYDMLLHDVALLNLHVVFAVDRAGLVGEDGETHHGLFDVGFLRQIPGMHIFAPANQAELSSMLRKAVFETDGPVAVRYPKGSDGHYTDAKWVNKINDHAVLTFVTYGTTVNLVLEAAELLAAEGIAVDMIKLDCIMPLDSSSIFQSVSGTGRMIVVEEAAEIGCVGQSILSELMCSGVTPCSKLMNYCCGIVTHGDLNSLRKKMGMDSKAIYQAAKELLKNET